MDAREYFRTVVQPNYNEFVQNPSEFRLLENALLSMNAVPEYLALDRLGYVPIRRDVLDGVARKIRHQFCNLSDLKFCAEACKHVRKIKDRSGGFTLQASSTSVEPNDQTTWHINGKHLVKVAHFAFAALKEISELK